MIKNKLFPLTILITAIAVSFSAAFYSVYGLSKLFAGASLAVIFMASSLELAKLVIASTLHRYWNTLYFWLKTYLVIALLVLICITSAGIYGFLSSAYQVTADQNSVIQKQVEILNNKKQRFEQSRLQYSEEKQQLVNAVTTLRTNLGTNNQRQTIDRRTGQVLTTITSSNKQVIQNEITATANKIEGVDKQINQLSDSISSLDVAIIELNASSESAAELGPLRYLSELTGTPMNVIINYLLLLIIFVFDPLAIALVVTANFSFAILNVEDKNQKSTSPIEQLPIIEEQVEQDTTTQDQPQQLIETQPTEVQPPIEVVQPTTEQPNDPDDNLSDLQRKVKEILPWAFSKPANSKSPDLQFREKRNSPHQQ